MSLVLKLDQESVDALREFSAVMPMIMDNIDSSTGLLLQTYFSLESKVGPHTEEFAEMMSRIEHAHRSATEALDVLPAMLEKIAGQIEEYIAFKGNHL